MFSYNYLIILGLLSLVVLIWFEGMRVHEYIITMCRKICRDSGLQLLDQTVSLGRIGLSRSGRGWLSVHREFRFEVSSNGTDRLKGYVTVEGRVITTVQIDYTEGTTFIYPQTPKMIH
jgi:hypothetical protein